MSSSTARRPPKTPRRTIRSAAWAVTLFLSAVAVLAALGFVTRALAPVTTDKDAPAVLVFIPHGASARQIGDLLAEKHLIRYAAGFALAARLEGDGDKMRAGRYELSPAMPPRQMAELIALGHTASDFVTVPEGYTARQVARRLAGRGMVDEKQFLALAQTQGHTFHIAGWTPPDASLEGYLFPDTYHIPRGTAPRQIIEQMLGEFHGRVVLPHQAEFARYPGGLPAAITLASLVEREAEVDADRPLIASALDNRLKQGMRLQCDATVQYALPQHKSRLFYSDLRVDSPYNTYLHAGLPPTPIASPGLPSIEAVLHPARTNYLYYVAGPDGSHVFSATLAEHDQAISAVRATAGGT